MRQRFFALVGVAAMVVLPVRYAVVLADDLAHPERWDQDWEHNPILYVPLTIVVVLVPLAFLIRELVRPRLAVRLQRMLDLASDLRSAGRHAEADQVLDEFQRLWFRHRLDKVRPLRK